MTFTKYLFSTVFCHELKKEEEILHAFSLLFFPVRLTALCLILEHNLVQTCMTNKVK